MLPFAILTLYTSLRQIPAISYEEHTGLGAGHGGKEFFTSPCPLSMPGVVSAIIVFSLGASSYISPLIRRPQSEMT